MLCNSPDLAMVTSRPRQLTLMFSIPRGVKGDTIPSSRASVESNQRRRECLHGSLSPASSQISGVTSNNTITRLLSIPSGATVTSPLYSPGARSVGIWIPHQRAWTFPLSTGQDFTKGLPVQSIPPVLKHRDADAGMTSSVSVFLNALNETLRSVIAARHAYTPIWKA